MARRPENVLGLLVRELTKQEIAIMEGRGCRADDWSLVQVAEDFDPFRVRRTHFAGSCVLGRFHGEVEVMPGMRLPTGIYDCTLIDCQVGNDCLLENVRFATHVVIERESVLFDIGSITCSGAATFGCGQDIPLACETGGRELPLWAEVDLTAATLVVRDREQQAQQAQLREAVAQYTKQLTSSVTWVRRGAMIRHTERLHDVYVGSHAVLDHANGFERVAVLSSPDEPTRVTGGATVVDSVLQWGVTVGGNAIIKHSVLLEHSAADDHATIEESLIGPNTTIAKGEVTASLVGPFVGFHHQSLLISAFWPEGRGNIAYGAMVGSNHTGRAPDQEIWPGEGTFFGLGCSIRFPSDFSAAPYTFISAGTNTLPQKVEFPFSLLSTPSDEVDPVVPRAYNEIQPGWGLYANAYGIERSELKFKQRDRATHHQFKHHILRPSVMRFVVQALRRLEAIDEPSVDSHAENKVREFYFDEHIPGLGKNVLRESARLRAIEAYRRVLKRWGLRILLGEREGKELLPESSEIAHELLAWLMPDTTCEQRLSELIEIERINAEIVQQSREADDQRGQRIIPGYAAVHVAAEQDPIVQRAWQRFTTTTERIKAVSCP